MNTPILILIFVVSILVFIPIVRSLSHFMGYWWAKGEMKAIEEEATKTINSSTTRNTKE